MREPTDRNTPQRSRALARLLRDDDGDAHDSPAHERLEQTLGPELAALLLRSLSVHGISTGPRPPTR